MGEKYNAVVPKCLGEQEWDYKRACKNCQKSNALLGFRREVVDVICGNAEACVMVAFIYVLQDCRLITSMFCIKSLE